MLRQTFQRLQCCLSIRRHQAARRAGCRMAPGGVGRAQSLPPAVAAWGQPVLRMAGKHQLKWSPLLLLLESLSVQAARLLPEQLLSHLGVLNSWQNSVVMVLLSHLSLWRKTFVESVTYYILTFTALPALAWLGAFFAIWRHWSKSQWGAGLLDLRFVLCMLVLPWLWRLDRNWLFLTGGFLKKVLPRGQLFSNNWDLF